MIVIILAAIGLCISLYAYYLEHKIKADVTYKPLCDINDRISCSKALQSPYANLFFLSNSILGLMYYGVVIAFALMGFHTLLTITTSLGAIVSIGLAYLLYFRIKSICLVCTSLYIVNGLLFIASIA